MNYSKALVTGGCGFIGSHLVDSLVERGVDVTVIDWVDPLSDRRNAKAHYIKQDIRSTDIEAAMISLAPEVVFHLAAHILDRASTLNPVMNADHNELGSINIFESAKRAGVKSIIFASSCAIYGLPVSVPVAESAAPCPRTPYGISKLAAEFYLTAYGLQSSMNAVALRFGNVYGPRQAGNGESGAIAIFTEKLLAGESPFLNGDGTTTRDYVYVLDVVGALISAADSELSGIFNVGTGQETTTSAVYRMVQSAIGTDITATPNPSVIDAVKRMAVDTTKIQSTLKWQPAMSLEAGIIATVNWYKNHQST